MRAAISLLVLLFSMCGVQTQSTQTEVQTKSQSNGAAAGVSTQVDIYAELKELRDMVVEQRTILKSTRVELQITKAQLNKMETDNNEQDKKLIVMAERLVASETRVEALEKVTAAQETELAVLNTRLAASEAEVMNLRKETAAQSADLRSVAERVAATETDMKHLKEDNAAQRTDLTTMKTDVMNLIKSNEATATEVEELKLASAAHEEELTAVKTRLAATETEVENLSTTPKVAFSAGLPDSGYLQAGNTDMNLVFSRVINNVGQAYSSTTGFFTAPVSGVYYFRFTVLDVLSSRSMSIRMFKNGQGIMWLNEYNTDGHNAYLSSGLTLQLEVGDMVNLGIRPGHRLYDSSNSHSTFSGFLLFPL